MPGFGLSDWFLWLRSVAAFPVRPGQRRFRPPGGPPNEVAGMVRAGQLGAGRARSRCQQVVNASFQGQVPLTLSTRLRACLTSRAGRCSSR